MQKNSPFHLGEQQAQKRWDTSATWDTDRQKQLLWQAIPPALQSRIKAAPFFFLATSDNEGRCDCSFKGGGQGIIHLIDDTRFAFPDFNGNGAFMSLGNILVNPQVGCLFIDFSDGGRLRINGRAEIIEGNEAKAMFADADRVVVISIEQVIPNCNAHIPRLNLEQINLDQDNQKPKDPA